jgi:hypothetical protein
MYWRLAASWLSAPSVRHWRRMSDERRGCATYSCGTYSARLNDAAGDCSVHAPKRTQHWSAANVMHCASVAGNVADTIASRLWQNSLCSAASSAALLSAAPCSAGAAGGASHDDSDDAAASSAKKYCFLSCR